MALRGKEEIFVRRFAGGGNDGVPSDPQGYGDRSRRFAARGNVDVHEDPKDVCESCDGYHPRRFAAGGNEDHDLIYDSSPVFDEYEDDVWYAWATGGSYCCGSDEAMGFNAKPLNLKIGDCDVPVMAIPSIKPQTMKKLNISFVFKETEDMVNLSIILNIQIQIKDKFMDMDKLTKITEKSSPFSNVRENKNSMVDPNTYGNFMGLKNAWVCGMNRIFHGACVESRENKKCDGQQMDGPNVVVHVNKQNGVGHVNLSDLIDELQMNGLVSGLKNNHSNINVGAKLFWRVESLVDERRFNIVFDPGGASFESCKTSREAEIFGLILIIIHENRLDVPFDPGGFGLEAKLGDEFFQRWGE